MKIAYHPCNQNLTERTKVPWFDNEVKEYKWIARCREKLWRKYHTPELWKAFQVARRSYHVFICIYILNVHECLLDAGKYFIL